MDWVIIAIAVICLGGGAFIAAQSPAFWIEMIKLVVVKFNIPLGQPKNGPLARTKRIKDKWGTH